MSENQYLNFGLTGDHINRLRSVKRKDYVSERIENYINRVRGRSATALGAIGSDLCLRTLIEQRAQVDDKLRKLIDYALAKARNP